MRWFLNGLRPNSTLQALYPAKPYGIVKWCLLYLTIARFLLLR